MAEMDGFYGNDVMYPAGAMQGGTDKNQLQAETQDSTAQCTSRFSAILKPNKSSFGDI